MNPNANASAAWPACTSALRLDRWILGELGPAEAGELGAHVSRCVRCARAAELLREAAREELPALRGGRGQVNGVAPRGTAAPVASASPVIPPAASAAASRGARAPRWLALAVPLAAAAALLLVVRPSGPAERTKGTRVALGMWVQHGDAVRRAGPGEVVAPGDAVRFAVTTPAPAFVAVLSVDPAGKASVYFPEGPTAAPVDAGADLPLPLATRLDGTVGREEIVGLFCREAVALEPVRARLESARSDAAATASEVAPGCQVTRWAFEKR